MYILNTFFSMKKWYLSIIALATLVVVGAGCTPVENNTNPSTKVKDATTPLVAATTTETTLPVTPPSEEASDVTLSAEALDNGQVKLSWTVPDSVSLTEANRFIIVEGEEANPVHDKRHNWFRQHSSIRAMVWTQRSSGTHHYRICITENNDHDTCVQYSNDVKAEIQ